MATRIDSDVYVTGALSCKSLSIPSATITDTAVASGAAIQATKLIHQMRASYQQPNTTATTETRVIYRCYGATATLIDFAAGSIAVAVGAATCTFDLKKNGTTVLTGVITLNSSSVAYVAQTGTLSVTSLVAGDVLSVVVTATAGGGTLQTGAFAFATIQEAGQ